MKKFLFNFLFIDQTTGSISTAKWWMNVGSLILCVGVIVNFFTPLTLDVNLLLTFAGTVLGARGFEKYLMKKMGVPDEGK
jgi:hypothetical protein